MLEERNWFVITLHGNMYQSGLPDLYAAHKLYGSRFIEVKLPGMVGSTFTPAQKDVFPRLLAHGTGIWILTGANAIELQKLFVPCNCEEYLLKKAFKRR